MEGRSDWFRSMTEEVGHMDQALHPKNPRGVERLVEIQWGELMV